MSVLKCHGKILSLSQRPITFTKKNGQQETFIENTYWILNPDTPEPLKVISTSDDIKKPGDDVVMDVYIRPWTSARGTSGYSITESMPIIDNKKGPQKR